MYAKLLLGLLLMLMVVPFIHAEDRDDQIMYRALMALRKAEIISVCGLPVRAERTKDGLYLSIPASNVGGTFEHKDEPVIDHENKKITFHLRNGKIDKMEWKDYPDYEVEVVTPAGSFLFNTAIFWIDRAQFLSFEGDPVNKTKDFEGVIQYTASGFKIFIGEGAGVFQTWTGCQLLAHRTGGSFGIQYTLTRSYLLRRQNKSVEDVLEESFYRSPDDVRDASVLPPPATSSNQ